MPQKLPLEKLCWQWAETTDPQNINLDNVKTAYRLNLPSCKLGACRRQCKGNPYCINGIGERVWFGEIEDTTWHDIQDPEEERRKPDTFVGLKNLGATCYVNTFLQLWFHNDTIKQGICAWREPGLDQNMGDEWKPSSVCAHLQVIFGLLEDSKRRYIDPRDFIQHLGLDAGQQQDAQEFSKLFLSVLEENMKQGQNSHNVIKEQFCGSYAYVTRCSNCNTASECPSQFYELDLTIQGHKTLQEALKAFLEVEKLEGDNKYMCAKCNCKQNATRAIELKDLPPVLNLQLLRFVFEVKTGSKKKLNSCIQFPEVLDMSSYLSGNQSAVYNLQAVLIHRGQSAYSGHYVAHIKGKDSQAWYKFNDEEIEKIKGRNLQLGSEDNLESKQKKTRTPKGFHASKNAYMLVYTKQTAEEGIEYRQVEDTGSTLSCQTELVDDGAGFKEVTKSASAPLNSENETESKAATLYVSQSEGMLECFDAMQEPKPSVSEPDQKPEETVNTGIPGESNLNTLASPGVKIPNIQLPPYVEQFVEKDNEAFEKWVNEMNEMKSKNIATGREKQETVKSIFQELVYLPSAGNADGFEWLPLQWLTKWLEDPNSVPQIDVSMFTCTHGKIDPELSAKLKCVSRSGSDQLFNIYGGKLRQQGLSSLCEACVKAKCNIIRTKQRIVEDDKYISSVMKKPIDEPCFWIGKASYRSWRRLALERISEKSVSERKGVEDRDMSNGDNETSDSSSTDEKLPQHNNGQNAVRDTNSDLGLGADADKEDVGHVGRETKSESDIQNQAPANPEGKHESDTCTEKVGNNDDEETLQFNEDLLCENHSGLEPDESCRRFIPESAWVRIKQYFPACPEFVGTTPPCVLCQTSIEEENQSRELNKQKAHTEKAALLDLFFDRKRPSNFSKNSTLFVTSTIFIDTWRQFIRDPFKNESPVLITNSVLLCIHGGYLFPKDNVKSDSNVTLLTEEEWNKLCSFYPADVEISVMSITQEGSSVSELVTEPPICNDCLVRKLSMEEDEIYDYVNETVYVCKHPKANKGLVNMNDNNDSGTDDPEFLGSGKKKGSGDIPDPTSEPPEKVARMSENGIKSVRKSQRRRHVRGEKKVTVSSKDTLKELKLQLMRLFSIPPFDQNLYLEGRLLSDNSCTLGSLKVAPGSVIDLVADEPQEDPGFLEEMHKQAGIPESGFKGTNLLSAS